MITFVRCSSIAASALAVTAASAMAQYACAPGGAFGILGYRVASMGTATMPDSAHPVYSFGAEPVVVETTRGNRLQPGDVVVAVNGFPITTRAGADKFAYPTHDDTLLTVRRNGSNIDIEYMPGRMCPGSNFVSALRRSPLDSGLMASAAPRGGGRGGAAVGGGGGGGGRGGARAGAVGGAGGGARSGGAGGGTGAVASLVPSAITYITTGDLLPTDSASRANVLRALENGACLTRRAVSVGRGGDTARAPVYLARVAPCTSNAVQPQVTLDSAARAMRSRLDSNSASLVAAGGRGGRGGRGAVGGGGGGGTASFGVTPIVSFVALGNFGVHVSCGTACERARATDGTSYWKFDGYPTLAIPPGPGADDVRSRTGIVDGDVVISVNGESPLTEKGALLLNHADRELTLKLEISRAGKRRTITLKL